MTQQEIARKLESRNMMAVSRGTGVSVTTLYKIRDMKVKAHGYNLTKIQEWLEQN